MNTDSGITKLKADTLTELASRIAGWQEMESKHGQVYCNREYARPEPTPEQLKIVRSSPLYGTKRGCQVVHT
jgi:hypothetical protein